VEIEIQFDLIQRQQWVEKEKDGNLAFQYTTIIGWARDQLEGPKSSQASAPRRIGFRLRLKCAAQGAASCT
jgi:hypothetical protein